jgi:hypothetical protein
MECISNLHDLLYYVVREVNKDVAKERNELIYLEWTVKYLENISNMHNAPQGFKTFFGTPKDNLGYVKGCDDLQYFKGWVGRIDIAYRKEPKGFGSDHFKKLRIYTGTGGYGSYNGYKIPGAKHYGYDLTIFLDDFPTIISGEAINSTGAFTKGPQIYRYIK